VRLHFRFVAYLFALIGFSSVASDPRADLIKAVSLDNARWVQQLLDAGADPNAPDASGQTPLILALREDARQAAAALIAHPKLAVDATNASNETALMLACLRGHQALAQQLVARGAALNRSGWTPLHYAASGPEPRLVAWLLDQGAAIDAPSPNRSTALMMAARYGAADSADLLLARGANAKLRNERDLSAADFARAAGREALAGRIGAASLR
jgi:ankyrin repeat protein